MRKLLRYLLFSGIIIFTACKEDPQFDYGNFRMDFTTVLSVANELQFLRDDGKILLSETNYTNEQHLSDGDRILLRYIPGEEISPTTSYIKIQSLALIPKGDIISVQKETQAESFGNDPSYITSMWPGGGYLNLRHKIEQNNETHQFALFYVQENQISPDTLYLELRHKAASDVPGYLSNSYASFSLNKIQDKIQKVKVLKVNANIKNLKQQYFIFNTQML